MAQKSSIKKRYWGFILYPESAPHDWLEQLRRSGLKCAVSPLHDKDVYTEDDKEGHYKKGDLKKAHYHVILCYGNTTTYNNVADFTHNTLNASFPQALISVAGTYDYFSHTDCEDEEKAVYNPADIICLNGFDITDYRDLSTSELNAQIKMIMTYILENEVLEYSDLMEQLYSSDDTELFTIARSHTIFFSNYLRSRRYRSEHKLKHVNPVTGEVFGGDD